MKRPRLLIEEWLPAAAIGMECIRERSTGQQPPGKHLHVWWASQPLAVSRAAMLAHPGPGGGSASASRRRGRATGYGGLQGEDNRVEATPRPLVMGHLSQICWEAWLKSCAAARQVI
jgi:hypothetical protein